MSNKEEVRALLSKDRDRFANITRDEFDPVHLQIRQYIRALGNDDATICTYDWYNEVALKTGRLANYVCSFVETVESMKVDSIMCPDTPQKPNPYYFTKCGYIILTNRDIGKKLVCMSPREPCSYYNHTQLISNDALMRDVLELVNEYFKLCFS